MSRVVLCLITTLLLVLLVGCASSETPAVDEIVQQLRAATPPPYHAVVESPTIQDQMQVIELWVKTEDQMRLQYLQSPFQNTRNALIVRNGGTAWYYQETDDLYYEGTPDDEFMSTVPAPTPARINSAVSQILETMDLTMRGVEEVAGRRAYKLHAESPDGPEEPYIAEATLWVDVEMWHVLRLDTTSRATGEETTSSLVTREIEYNPDFPDGVFTFTPPAGAHEYRP